MVMVTVPSAATPSEDPEPLLHGETREPVPATAVRLRPPRSRLRREMRDVSGSFKGKVSLLFPGTSAEVRTVTSSPVGRCGLLGLSEISNDVRYDDGFERNALPRRVSTHSSGASSQESASAGRPLRLRDPRETDLRVQPVADQPVAAGVPHVVALAEPPEDGGLDRGGVEASGVAVREHGVPGNLLPGPEVVGVGKPDAPWVVEAVAVSCIGHAPPLAVAEDLGGGDGEGVPGPRLADLQDSFVERLELHAVVGGG